MTCEYCSHYDLEEEFCYLKKEEHAPDDPMCDQADDVRWP
jgi:hypothetical protein